MKYEPLVKGGQSRAASDVVLSAISAAVFFGFGALALAAIVIGAAWAAAGK